MSELGERVSQERNENVVGTALSFFNRFGHEFVPHGKHKPDLIDGNNRDTGCANLKTEFLGRWTFWELEQVFPRDYNHRYESLWIQSTHTETYHSYHRKMLPRALC